MFTRHISVTRLHESTLIVRCTHSGYSIDVKTKNKYINFVTKILRKTCSSLAKIISEGENNFTQTNYDKLPKISAKNKCGFFCKKISAKVQIWDHQSSIHGVDLIDTQTYFYSI